MGKIDRQEFFAAIRPSFGGKLSQTQVEGIDAILQAGSDLPTHHLAHCLAHVRRETGGGMYPIKETVMPSHKDKNPSDTEVILRLDVAFAKGQLPWVKTPYWRGGAFGRGQIQVTHADNYLKFAISNYADALKLDVSARVVVEGMSQGKFTGRKLSDYDFPAALDAPPARNPRRIVNGKDGSDAEVARYHRQFYEAIMAAQKSDPVVKPAAPHVTETPKNEHEAPVMSKKSGWAALIAAILSLFRKGA